MKRVLRLLIRLYPAWWRRRYGAELDALLEDSGSGSREVWDLFRAAMEMQMKSWSLGRIVTVCAIAGVIVAGGVAFSRPQQYRSTSTLELDHPVQDVLDGVVEAAFTSQAFTTVIHEYNLYPRERTSMSMDDVVKVMRQEARVSPLSPHLLQVSFTYENPVQAQRVSRDLVGRIIAANLSAPNAGGIQLVEPAGQAQKTIRDKVRVALTSLGLPVGMLLGAFLALFLRRGAPTIR